MRLRYLVAALVVLVALAALACNGDDSGPAETPSAVEEAVAAPSPAAEAFSFDCAAPAGAVRPDASGFPAEVTDSVGNTVTLEAPPERIASLSAGHTEILYAIGAGEQMAAVDNTSDCPQAVNDLPKVDAFSPSVEAIAGLDPDLVIIFFDPGDLQSSLQDLGVPVLNLSAPESVQGVYQQMVLLGMATGHVDEAEEVAARMEEAVGNIRSQLQDVTDGPSVFHEVDNTYFRLSPTWTPARALIRSGPAPAGKACPPSRMIASTLSTRTSSPGPARGWWRRCAPWPPTSTQSASREHPPPHHAYR